MNTFTKKTLELTIELTEGTFNSASSTRVIRGLACEAVIEKVALPDKNRATLDIWGMDYAEMAELTRLFNEKWQPECHRLTISAGEEDGPLAVAFVGEITEAYANFTKAPDVCMHMVALTGAYAQMLADKPVSIKGEAPAAQLIEQFAGQAGFTFTNRGVTASVRNAVLNGSPLKKARDLAAHVQAALVLDDNALYLLPEDGCRQGAAVRLAPETGLLGYPSFTSHVVRCACLYHPDLQYHGLIELDSVVPGTSGIWRIEKLTHTLHAHTNPQGGRTALWQSEIEAKPHEN